MGFRKDAYAKVWKLEKPEGKNYFNAQISINRKKDDGYETEFSSFVRLVGEASKKAESLNVEDNLIIKLGDVDVTNNYVKEKNTTYWNCTVFDFDVVEKNE